MPVIHGINAVLEALRARPQQIERICVDRSLKNARINQIVEMARQMNIRVSFQEKSWLNRKAGDLHHQGVICYCAEIATYEAEEILRQAKSPALVLVLDGIEDPQNTGAILRSAEAAGVDGVFLPRYRSTSLSATVIKASAGAASHIKVARVPNIVRLIEFLKVKGLWVAGLDAAAQRRIWEVDLTVPVALILGSEGKGLHRLVKEKCDFLASLPIRGNVKTYNVSVAAGIALYEVLRQRADINAM